MASLFRRSDSKKWWIRYRDADDVIRRVPAFADKRASEKMAADLEREVEREKAGLVDPFEKQMKRPLSEHLADFRRSLKDKGVSAESAGQKARRAEAVAAGCRFAYYRDVNGSAIEEYLAKLPVRSQTRNHYLQAFKQFCAWMVKDRRAGFHPIQHLSGRPVTDNSTYRAMDDSELDRLLHAARVGRKRFGIPGPDREMLYEVAAFTGFRALELASMTPESFRLDAELPTVVLPSAATKNRKGAGLPVFAPLVPRLKAWLSTKEPGRRLWPGNWAVWKQGSKMVHADAKDAGIAIETDDGKLVFHSLRHTFITKLARAGVPLTTAQKLARHSDPKLTANRYTHLGIVDLAGAVDSLAPPNRSRESESQALKATGTDGKPVQSDDGETDDDDETCAQKRAFFDAQTVYLPALFDKIGKERDGEPGDENDGREPRFPPGARLRSGFTGRNTPSCPNRFRRSANPQQAGFAIDSTTCE